MLVSVVGGSDKTTVSIATGGQEYHPFYVSPGNLTNTARRGHGSGIMPVGFLPIPKGVCALIIYELSLTIFQHLKPSENLKNSRHFLDNSIMPA